MEEGNALWKEIGVTSGNRGGEEKMCYGKAGESSATGCDRRGQDPATRWSKTCLQIIDYGGSCEDPERHENRHGQEGSPHSGLSVLRFSFFGFFICNFRGRMGDTI